VASMWDGLGEEQKQVRNVQNGAGINLIWGIVYSLIEAVSEGFEWILQIPVLQLRMHPPVRTKL
jgi:hypothetical protein